MILEARQDPSYFAMSTNDQKTGVVGLKGAVGWTLTGWATPHTEKVTQIITQKPMTEWEAIRRATRFIEEWTNGK